MTAEFLALEVAWTESTAGNACHTPQQRVAALGGVIASSAGSVFPVDASAA